MALTRKFPPESSYGVAVSVGSVITAAVVEYHLIHSIAGVVPSTATLNVPGVDPGKTVHDSGILNSC